MPYTEAMQDLNNMSPKYDEGSDIYDALIDSLDVALSKATAANKVCTNLLYPDQDATNWIRFANAVKLKMLMRESGVKDVQAKLDALVAQGNFPTADVEYKGFFKNESGQMSRSMPRSSPAPGVLPSRMSLPTWPSSAPCSSRVIPTRVWLPSSAPTATRSM